MKSSRPTVRAMRSITTRRTDSSACTGCRWIGWLLFGPSTTWLRRYARDDKSGTLGMTKSLQWGGRFGAPPDAALLAFGSSLDDDLVLAPFDVQTSQAHVDALAGGK